MHVHRDYSALCLQRHCLAILCTKPCHSIFAHLCVCHAISLCLTGRDSKSRRGLGIDYIIFSLVILIMVYNFVQTMHCNNKFWDCSGGGDLCIYVIL